MSSPSSSKELSFFDCISFGIPALCCTHLRFLNQYRCDWVSFSQTQTDLWLSSLSYLALSAPLHMTWSLLFLQAVGEHANEAATPSVCCKERRHMLKALQIMQKDGTSGCVGVSVGLSLSFVPPCSPPPPLSPLLPPSLSPSPSFSPSSPFTSSLHSLCPSPSQRTWHLCRGQCLHVPYYWLENAQGYQHLH